MYWYVERADLHVQKLPGFSVGINIYLVVAWVVEIDVISVRGGRSGIYFSVGIIIDLFLCGGRK